jgi:predicted amidophosphoribosyltransferase
MTVTTTIVESLRALVDLVLPAECGGCGLPSTVECLCPACAVALRVPPALVRPRPAPPGLPPCLAGAAYEGPVRRLLLEYKERGQRRLARPLGDVLGAVVEAGLPSVDRASPLALIPVPATAAAVRARHGDHMWALGLQAADRLRRRGWRAVQVLSPLRALPRPDSTTLDRYARRDVARSAFALRAEGVAMVGHHCRDALVVVLDDVVTTGATLAAVAGLLARADAPVAFAATVAATQRRVEAVA